MEFLIKYVIQIGRINKKRSHEFERVRRGTERVWWEKGGNQQDVITISKSQSE